MTAQVEKSGSTWIATDRIVRDQVLVAAPGQVVPDAVVRRYGLDRDVAPQTDDGPPAPPVPDGLPPPEATIAAVTAWVGEDPQRAAAALAQERANQGRATLVPELERIAGAP